MKSKSIKLSLMLGALLLVGCHKGDHKHGKEHGDDHHEDGAKVEKIEVDHVHDEGKAYMNK